MLYWYSAVIFAALVPSLAALQPPTVIVTGATGRVGRLVVERLLARQDVATTVRAVVRNLSKATEVLPSCANIELVECDLGGENAHAEIRSMCDGADAVIWCASGFKEDGTLVDIEGVGEFASALLQSSGSPAAAPKGGPMAPGQWVNGKWMPKAERASAAVPKVVLCSSAGVTRPEWSDEKKERLVGAADIPIIRLNPGGILGQKVAAETKLRESGVPYCIVRPTGLKDDWPQGRAVLSQGDVAVGRTNPLDLADVLVSALEEPEADGKTFEMFTLAGYPAGGLGGVLGDLAPDGEASFRQGEPMRLLDEAAVEAQYRVLQQLLPGEQQDATKLEMGRTYEQVDAGEVAARERGAAPSERELAVAGGALESMGMGMGMGGGETGKKRRFLKRLFRMGE